MNFKLLKDIGPKMSAYKIDGFKILIVASLAHICSVDTSLWLKEKRKIRQKKYW